jgi:predicted nucleic acid-binding protein
MNREISKIVEQVLNRILQSVKPVKNLVQFFVNLTTSKQSKTPTLKKTSQKLSSAIQIKKVDHKQQTLIPLFFEKPSDPVIQSHPTIITVDSECISQLEPGIVIDANVLMRWEDFDGKYSLPDITKHGHDIIKKLQNKPIYVPDTIEEEFRGKRCPRNRREIIRDAEKTGTPRNFNNTLAELLKKLGVDIYYVEIQNSSELHRKANECLTKFSKVGLHKPDDMYLALACVTKSDLLTLDCPLMESSKKAGVKSINFHLFLDKIMKKSPMTIIVEERKKLHQQHKKSVPVILFGNQNSFKPGILKEWGRLEIPTMRGRKK